MTNFVSGLWSRPFCLELEPEPSQFGRSQSRLWDLGLPEPVLEPPNQVAALQQWLLQNPCTWKFSY